MPLTHRTPCLPGTRSTIINRITDWAIEDAPSNAGKGIFWLHGMAGTGKSTIATTIAEHFRKLERQGAYLFFERSKSTSDPGIVIRTLAYKLASFDESIGAAISESLRASKDIAERPFDEQFEKLLRYPLTKASPKLVGPIVVVLDALDECGNSSSREPLLKTLAEGLPKLPDIFRFLVTSRFEDDIASWLSRPSSVERLRLTTDQEESGSDIYRYIQSEMHSIRVLRNMSDDWPCEEEIKKLAQYSGGLFIWVSTVSTILRKETNPKKQLGSLFSSGMANGLDSLYSVALESSCQWETTESWHDFQDIMAIALFSREHLDDHTIDQLLCRSEDNSCRRVLSRLGCVLDYSPGKPIRALHASFRDYLTNTPYDDKRPWSLSSINPEHLLAECCLRVMSGQLHFNMFDIKTSYQRDRDHFRVNAKAPISSELAYACQNWWKHLESVQTLEQSDPLAKALFDFGSEQFLFWMEVVSVMKTSGRHKACKIVAELMKVSIFILYMYGH